MTLEPGKKARLTTAVVLLMVFGAGTVLGMALNRRLEARGMEEAQGMVSGRSGPSAGERSRRFDPRTRDSMPGPGESRDSVQRRPTLIVDQVGLSEDQKEQVDSIVGHYRGLMRALHEEFDEVYSTRYREITQATREEIKSVLTADQQATYDSLLAEWDARRRDRRPDSARGGGGSR